MTLFSVTRGGETARKYGFTHDARQVVRHFSTTISAQELTGLPPWASDFEFFEVTTIQGLGLEFVVRLSPLPVPVYLGRMEFTQARAGECNGCLHLAQDIAHDTRIPHEYRASAEQALTWGRGVLVLLWQNAIDALPNPSSFFQPAIDASQPTPSIAMPQDGHHLTPTYKATAGGAALTTFAASPANDAPLEWGKQETIHAPDIRATTYRATVGASAASTADGGDRRIIDTSQYPPQVVAAIDTLVGLSTPAPILQTPSPESNMAVVLPASNAPKKRKRNQEPSLPGSITDSRRLLLAFLDSRDYLTIEAARKKDAGPDARTVRKAIPEVLRQLDTQTAKRLEDKLKDTGEWLKMEREQAQKEKAKLQT